MSTQPGLQSAATWLVWEREEETQPKLLETANRQFTFVGLGFLSNGFMYSQQWLFPSPRSVLFIAALAHH